MKTNTPKRTLPLTVLIKRSTLMELAGVSIRDCLNLERDGRLPRVQLRKKRRGAHRGGTVRYRREHIIPIFPELN